MPLDDKAPQVASCEKRLEIISFISFCTDLDTHSWKTAPSNGNSELFLKCSCILSMEGLVGTCVVHLKHGGMND